MALVNYIKRLLGKLKIDTSEAKITKEEAWEIAKDFCISNQYFWKDDYIKISVVKGYWIIEVDVRDAYTKTSVDWISGEPELLERKSLGESRRALKEKQVH